MYLTIFILGGIYMAVAIIKSQREKNYTVLKLERGKLRALYQSTYYLDNDGNLELTGLLHEVPSLFLETVKAFQELNDSDLKTFSIMLTHDCAESYSEILVREFPEFADKEEIIEVPYPSIKYSFEQIVLKVAQYYWATFL